VADYGRAPYPEVDPGLLSGPAMDRCGPGKASENRTLGWQLRLYAVTDWLRPSRSWHCKVRTALRRCNTHGQSLLAVEMNLIYGLIPQHGSVVPGVAKLDVSVVVGWSDDDRVLAVGSDARRVLDDAGQAVAMLTNDAYEPGKVPELVSELSRRLARGEPARKLSVTGGPCFTFPAGINDDFGARFPVIVSDCAGCERAGQLDRPSNWGVDEWAALTEGNLGSWAFAVDGAAVVSICHTPAGDHDASEAGVWTREDYRGRSLACAVVKAWWEWERQFKRTLFYSTSSDNHASQAVARKLGLEPLGWLWVVR
jgi:hypothetical protein